MKKRYLILSVAGLVASCSFHPELMSLLRINTSINAALVSEVKTQLTDQKENTNTSTKKDEVFEYNGKNQYKGEKIFSITYKEEDGYLTFGNHANFDPVEKIVINEGSDAMPNIGRMFPNVKEIVCPSTMKQTKDLFYHVARFRGLVKVTVSKDNHYLADVDGVLYTKNLDTLICYPGQRDETEYVLPSETREILGGISVIQAKKMKKFTFGEHFGEGQERITIPTSFRLIEKVTVQKNNKYIKEVDDVIYNKKNKQLIMIPISKKGDLVIEEGTEEINAEFESLEIKNVIIPSSLKENSSLIFRKLENLESITVSKDNPYLSSVDGILYNKSQTELLVWPKKLIQTKLTFPSTLLKLDLTMCDNIEIATSIRIPRDLLELKGGNGNYFTSIKLEDGNKNFVLDSNILYKKDLSEIALYLPEIPRTSLTLKEGLKELNLNVFSNRPNQIVTVTLPKSLSSITSHYPQGDSITSGFEKLKKIILKSGNKYFKVSNGILYDKKMTELVWFPSDLKIKTYTLPQSVTKILNGQLYRQNYVEVINIHKHWKKLYGYSPQGCSCYTTSRDANFFEIGQKCPMLRAINIKQRSNKTRFYSKDGVVYDRLASFVALYPSAKRDKTYKVPDGFLFARFSNGNPYLEKLDLGNSIKRLYGTNQTLFDKHYEFDGEEDPIELYDYLLYYPNLKQIVIGKKNSVFKVASGGLFMAENNGYKFYAFPMGSKRTELYIPSFMTDSTLPKTVLNYKGFKSICVSPDNSCFSTNGKELFYDGKLIYSIEK